MLAVPMLVYILVAALILSLIGLLAYKIWNEINSIDLSFDYSNLPPDPPPERWDKPFVRTGDEDLPYAIRLRGKAYRWQQPARVHLGDQFYKMFEDGPWKWKAQGRFAGAALNCGHYFGLSVEAATEEAAHYGMHPENAVLIQITGGSRRILDLTHPDVIKSMFQQHVENHHVVSWSYYSMMDELIERGDGGNVVTDYLGVRAKREGYQGILFFSARVLRDIQLFRMDRVLEAYTYRAYIWEKRRDLTNLNIVFISGAELVHGIKTIKIGDAEPFVNPYYEIGIDKVYTMFPEHGEDYQLEQDHFLITKPSYVDPEEARRSGDA
jgi:hypothetical protein